MERAVDVDELVERAGQGDPRAVARLVSLIEDASPLLREVTAALTPLAGNARVIGLTGSPGADHDSRICSSAGTNPTKLINLPERTG